MMNRPPIPRPMKREIRQRCGFGCVICGKPLYEYDHIEGWAKGDGRHVADEITLLCSDHHSQKTRGLLPVEMVRQANQEPFSLRSGSSAPFMLQYSGTTCSADLGSNTFTLNSQISDLFAIAIDGVPLVGFRFEDGHYLLNVELYDESNNKVLEVVDNELVYSVGSWDIEFVGNQITLRAAPRSIFVELVFETPHTIRIPRGRVMYNGVELLLTPHCACVLNNNIVISRYRGANHPVGFGLGDSPADWSIAFRVSDISRSGQNRDERLEQFRDSFRGDAEISRFLNEIDDD